MIYFGELTQTYKEKNSKIVKYFGTIHQYKKFLEEIKELFNEIDNLLNFVNRRRFLLNRSTIDKLMWEYILEKDNILENGFINELVDCQILAEQLNESNFFIEFVSMSLKELDLVNILYSPQGKNIITQCMEYKIDRTLERYNIK